MLMDSGRILTGWRTGESATEVCVSCPDGSLHRVPHHAIRPSRPDAIQTFMNRVRDTDAMREVVARGSGHDNKHLRKRRRDHDDDECGWSSARMYDDAADRLADINAHDRTQDTTYGTRTWNNIVKCLLIEAAVGLFPAGSRHNVLDLCVGKGQDLHKLREAMRKCKQSIALMVGVDSAPKPLTKARERAGRTCHPPWCSRTEFHRADLSRPRDSWVDPILAAPPRAFSIVSCQLALHYFFKSQVSLATLLDLIAATAAPGAIVIMTYISGTAVVKAARREALRLRDADEDITDPIVVREGELGLQVPLAVLHAANGLDATLEPSATPYNPYGQKYVFSLGDVIRRSEEYLVHEETLDREAQARGLIPVLQAGFRDVVSAVATHGRGHLDMLRRMRAPFSRDKPLDPELWSHLSLYSVRAFVAGSPSPADVAQAGGGLRRLLLGK